MVEPNLHVVPVEGGGGGGQHNAVEGDFSLGKASSWGPGKKRRCTSWTHGKAKEITICLLDIVLIVQWNNLFLGPWWVMEG